VFGVEDSGGSRDSDAPKPHHASKSQKVNVWGNPATIVVTL
jgi:hypothetical protein